MAKCANRNTAEYKALKKRFKTDIMVGNIIDNYQAINNTDIIPSVVDALKLVRDRKAALATKKKEFMSALKTNITNTRKASTLDGQIYVNNTIKGTRISNKGVAKQNVEAIATFLRKNNIPFGPGLLVDIQETDNTYRIVFNENLFTPQDAIPENTEKMSGTTKAILAHLNRAFPQIEIKNVSRKEGQKIYNQLPAWAKSQTPWDQVKSFYFNGQAYIVGSRITGDVAIEEVMHPLVDALYTENKQLFDNLLGEAKTTFVQLKQQIDQAYNKDRGFSQTQRDIELVTQALVRHFRKEYESGTPGNSFMETVKKFLEWFSNVIKDLHKFVSGRQLKVENIKPTASLSDVAKLLNTPELTFKFEFRRPGKIRYSLTPLAEAAYQKALQDAHSPVQRAMVKKMLNTARESTVETDLAVAKNSDFHNTSSFIVRNDSDHTYYNVETGEQLASATTIMKGKLANEKEVALNLAIGNDFDAILNGVAAGMLIEDIQDQLTTLNKEQAIEVFTDLKTHLDTIMVDGSVVIPQVVLFDDQPITGRVFDKNGKLVEVNYAGVAGTADLLVISPDGKIKIVDLKTSQNYLKNDPEYYDRPFPLQDDSFIKQKDGSQEALSTRAQHYLQMAMYRRMLHNMGYPVSNAVDAITTFHVKVGIKNTKKGKVWDGTYDVEGIYAHYKESTMERLVELLIPENINEDQRARIHEERKKSVDYNPAQDSDYLTDEEKQSENNDATSEVDFYLRALEGYQADLLKRREALQNIKGGITLDKTKEATIESINDIISGIEVAATSGPQAIKAEYTRAIRQAIKDVQAYTDYILEPANVGRPEYINYVLNFDRYSQSFRSLIEMSSEKNSPLSKAQANLVLNLQSKLNRLKGSKTQGGLIETAIFNFVKETVKMASSAELSDTDLEEILSVVRDMGDIEYYTGDMATNRDTLLAVLDKIYKAKVQEFLDKAQAREEIIREYANTLAKLDPSTKPEDLYNYMVEFDKEGLPTGFIVQRLGQQYYDKIFELRQAMFDEDGNRMVYKEIFNEEEAKASDLEYNKKLWALKQEAANFWKAERTDTDGNIIDGNYHRYTDSFKELRSKYETPTVSDSGIVIWKKKRTVTEKVWRNYRNTYGTYKETYFAQKIGGEPTGVITPGQVWVPHNRFRVANDSAVVKGKKISLLNSKYRDIMEPAQGDALAKARKEFYMFYVDTMKELVDKLPPSMSEQMQGRIPTIKSNIANRLREEKPYFTKLFSKMKRGVSDLFTETGTYRRVVTNEKDEMINSLPIYFTGSLAKKGDLEKIEKDIEVLRQRRIDKEISSKDFEEQEGKLLAQKNRIENKATAENLSLDLGSSLLKFNSMAENFEIMSSIEDIVSAFIRVSENRTVLQEKAKNDWVQKVVGKTKSMFKPVGEAEIDQEKNIKKRIKKWARMVYYDDENLTQSALEKMTNGLLQYSSFAYVATNPLGNINNLIIGKLNNTLELIGGKYYKRKAYMRMKAAFNREQVIAKQVRRTGYILDGKKGVYDPKKPMTKWEGWVDSLRMMDSKTEIRETGAVEEGESAVVRFANWFYLLNDSFEYNVQTMQGMAMVESHVAVDEGGVEMGLYEASTFNHETQKIEIDPKYTIYDMDGNKVEWNDEYRYQLRNNIREVNKRVHGNYARADRMVMQSHFLGKLAVQFKKWVAPLLKNRLRSEYYDENLGWTEGRYRSFVKFFAFAMKNISEIGNLETAYRQELRNDFENETGIDYGHIDKRIKERIMNSYQTLGEIGVVLLLFSLSSLMDELVESEDDDGYWVKRLKNLSKYNVDRAAKELVAFWPVIGTPQAWQLVKNPIASAGVLQNFVQATYVTANTGIGWLYYDGKEFRADKDYVYQRGRKKGTLKLRKEWNDVLPFLSTIQRFQNFDQERKFYVN